MVASLQPPARVDAVRQLLAGLERVKLSAAARVYGLRPGICPHRACGKRIGIWGDFNWTCWTCGAGSTPAAFVAVGLFGLTVEQAHRVTCTGCEVCGFWVRGKSRG